MTIKRILMFPLFHLILKPLIKRNYTVRHWSAINENSAHPDHWYWADELAIRYGYSVSGFIIPGVSVNRKRLTNQ